MGYDVSGAYGLRKAKKKTIMNAKLWMMLALAALGVAFVPQAGRTAPAAAFEHVVGDKGETPTAQDAKMEWFREARFGLFFNFGLYSYYGGIWKGQVRMSNRCSEWMMIAARAPVAEYAEAAKVFDPQGFDADEWIRTVREAGARYVVFDAKHHDGFALFRTKASPFNIVDATPLGRDLVAEIAAACRKYGVKFGIHYSQHLEWHPPPVAAVAAVAVGTPRRRDAWRITSKPSASPNCANSSPTTARWTSCGTTSPTASRRPTQRASTAVPRTRAPIAPPFDLPKDWIRS